MQIPFYKNYWSQTDLKNTTKVIKRSMYWANGPEINKFENRLAKFTGSKYALAFNSGTSALHAILACLEIKGREVIVPSFTFIATANSVIHAGGIPVFADIEDQTFGLDPEDVERRITKKTIAIMPIHYGGCSCQINKLKAIAKKHNLLLIEDAAESLGAKVNNKMVGNFGIAAIFSFTPTKVISTGEGGIAVTNSKKLYQKIQLFRSHGRLETEDYFTSIKYMDYITLGYGFRMPTICAAQGLAQLKKINTIIKKRQKIAKLYDSLLSQINQISLPFTPPQYNHIYQMYTIRVKQGRRTRDRLQQYLKKQGITAKVYFEPIHQTYYYKKVLKNSPKLPTTETLANQVLSLPIYPQLSVKEVRYIINKIKNFYAKPK